MKIKSIAIQNFRGYKDEIKINFDDLTAFVGKNDIGKSTVLEALDIFFNEGSGIIKLDKSDLNIYSVKENNEETMISVCFSDLPEQIVIDSTVHTTLTEEYMLNSDGLLEIVKRYKNGGKPSVFIKAFHPTNSDCKDLLLKKNQELKNIIKEKNIDCENQKINALMRKAIWSSCSGSLALRTVEIDVSKEDAKKIWEKLNAYLPLYSLFQSDRKNSDGDSEVQDPLKEAVKQIFSNEEIQKTLSSVAQIVETRLREVSDRTLDKLKEMDPTVASSLNPVIPTADKLKWADVFKTVSIAGDEDIPINKRGSGVKRLVLLNFFRAEAERRSEERDTTGIIYAIEEPETSQHTNNQRMLIKALKELSNEKNIQVILTTHSPTIVKELNFENIRLIRDIGGSKQVITVEPSVLQYPSLNEVNYLAYDEVNEEYHNELYGFLEFHNWLKEYKEGRPLRKYQYLDNKTGKLQDWRLELSAYIRHQIHHPENRNNDLYTEKELRDSIEDMRRFIQTKINREESIDEPLREDK